MSAAFTVQDLSLTLAGKPILRGVSFEARAGQVSALVGGSGSGKSITLLTALGLQPPDAVISGTATLHGAPLLGLDEAALRRIRGARIGMVFQEVMTALNPVRSIGAQVAEAVLSHEAISRQEAASRARVALDRVGLSHIPAARYPHQLSGGQRQRVAIAMAIVLGPDVLLADEPTTALDVTTQKQVMDLLVAMAREDAMALVLVSHDLGLVGAYADQVSIIQEGAVVERTAPPLSRVSHPYSRRLLAAAVPRRRRGVQQASGEALLDVQDLRVRYAHGVVIDRQRSFEALKGVSFVVRRGESVGVVGESGAGKSTLARAVLGLQAACGGQVMLKGQDVATAQGAELKVLRRAVQIVFQDPYGSFNPRHRAGTIISEPLHLIAPRLSREETRERVSRALVAVGLDRLDADKYPHAFSGGQRQRLAIARAMVIEPAILVLDEPVSALDVTVRAQILDLLVDVSQRTGVAMLFISHDLDVVQAVCDRVIVLKDGAIVEQGDVFTVLQKPQHPYTQTLVAATLRISP